jgi:hypothetical protein
MESRRIMIRSRGLLWLPLLVTLAACGSSENEMLAPAKSGEAISTNDKIVAMSGANIGTPMAERIAVLGLLNKRNGQTRDVELKPGEAIRFDKVVIRLRACEKTAPWENRPDEGAFVQLLVNELPPGTTEAERWRSVFSGWLFKENPAANVVEHPIYDVWVKACKMRFPGEEAPLEKKSSEEATAADSAAEVPSSEPQSPPEPAPAAADNASPDDT